MRMIQDTPVQILFTAVEPGIVRITVAPESEPDPTARMDAGYLVDGVAVQRPDRVLHAGDPGGTWEYNGLSVCLADDTCGIEIRTPADGLLQRIAVESGTGDVLFRIGDRPVHGLGQGFATPMDRRGHVYDMKTHGQVRESVFEYATVSAIPYLASRGGWGLFFHQPVQGVIDLSGEIGRFQAHPTAYRDIFVMRHDRPAEAARAYYRLTGIPPVPPRYTFGFQQSYRELVHRGESIVLPTARYMREHGIPCDVLIYLGRYVECGWNTYGDNGMFEFNPRSFPDPEGTVAELHAMGYAVALHITETPSGLHGTLDDPDVNPLEHDHVGNLWKKHEELHRTAQNDGWWPDDGDELDLAAVRARHRMYRDGTERLTPGRRGFYMLRNSYCGDARYGGTIWSGDVLCRWSTLRNHIQVGLNVSMSLNPYWGSDIGGFHVTGEYSGELYLRWLQYSVFTPMFRSHGRPSFLHNPWGWTARSVREIPDEWARGIAENMSDEVLPDPRVEPVARRYIGLRYRLVPYLYTLARELYDTGTPPMRPLWFRYPGDPMAEGCESQYMLGDSLLVSPVTEEGASTWTIRLPAGTWYDFATGERLEGGRPEERPVTIEDCPVYVPAGTILPLGEVRPFLGTKPVDPLDERIGLRVYEGADARFTLYEDDGATQEYRDCGGIRTEFVWDDRAGTLTAGGWGAGAGGRTRTFEAECVPSGRRFMVVCAYAPDGTP